MRRFGDKGAFEVFTHPFQMKPCVSQRFVAFQAKPRLARHVDVNPELGVRVDHI